MNEWLAIFIGGGMGSLLRYALTRWFPPEPTGFPTATFLANVLACLVMGLALHLFSRSLQLPESYRLMVLTGFCGGFSTFSTFSLDTLRLVQAGDWTQATLYAGLSFLSCLLVLYLLARLAS